MSHCIGASIGESTSRGDKPKRHRRAPVQAAEPLSSSPGPQHKEGADQSGDVEHQGGWQQSQDHPDVEANERPSDADERACHVGVSRYELPAKPRLAVTIEDKADRDPDRKHDEEVRQPCSDNSH